MPGAAETDLQPAVSLANDDTSTASSTATASVLTSADAGQQPTAGPASNDSSTAVCSPTARVPTDAEADKQLTAVPASPDSSSAVCPTTIRVPTAAEADKQLTVGLAAAASAGDLLYLLRALSAWQWEEALHAVLLPAVVAALQGKVSDMGLQVRPLMTVVCSSAQRCVLLL
jgi:hypothetical protein